MRPLTLPRVSILLRRDFRRAARRSLRLLLAQTPAQFCFQSLQARHRALVLQAMIGALGSAFNLSNTRVSRRRKCAKIALSL